MKEIFSPNLKIKEILQKTLSEKIPNLPQDKYIISSIQISIFLVFLSLGFFLFHLLTNRLPPELPLYYSQSWGTKQLAAKYELLILPLSALFFFIVNFIFARSIYNSHKILARLLLSSSALFSLLSSLTLYQIITLVT